MPFTERTVMMDLEKETKGAVQYKEVNDMGAQVPIADALMGTLYLRKSALGSHLPSSIKVTVSVPVGG